MMKNRSFWVLLCVGGMFFAGAASAAGDTNTWLGKTTNWAEASNWSAGAAPSGARARNVLIPAVRDEIYPALGDDAVVGGFLRIGKGARFSLNGHGLQIGKAIPETFDERNLMYLVEQESGLTIETNARLLSEQGSPTITIHAGGLVNHGDVRGKVKLRIVGRSRGFCVNGGKGLELTELSFGASPFPYPVIVGGRVLVHGDLELAGGKLVIKPSLNRYRTKFVVKGNLIFRGSKPCVMLVTEGSLLVHGTIKSEGSAFCVITPGAVPMWNSAEGAAFYRPSEKDGWVRMVGAGDQMIESGGILPPIVIDKSSGKVTVSGDLHCSGLHIKKGNTLHLSPKQKLIFGHHLREYAGNPELGSLPRHGPCRRCRDLINEGAITGTQSVLITFLLNLKGRHCVVEASYRPPKFVAKGDSMGGGIDAAAPWRAPGALSVNRLDSRIQIKNGKLFLDGKPHSTAGVKSDADLELDAVIDDLEESSATARPGAQAKAVITSLNLKTVTDKFKAPESLASNIAPYAGEIAAAGRISTTWAVSSLVWAWRDIYALVDGDPDIGFGGNALYDFLFPEAVTIGAVRLISGTQIYDAFQFALYADTTGDGGYDTILAWRGGGRPPKEKSWLTWGRSWVTFPPRKVHRLRFRAFTPEGETSRPALGEFEIYGDRKSYDRLLKQEWIARTPKLPEHARFLSYGDTVTVNWPEPAPENRVHKIITAAFWMFGVGWQGSMDEEYWKKFPPLRKHPPCVKVLDEMKDKYKYDAVKLFFEGEEVGVPWPSINFKSALNARYLNKRRTALKIGEALKPKKAEPGDEFDEILDEEEPDDEKITGFMEVEDPSIGYSKELKIEDLPCQRNLMTEFCEAAHERGLAVHVICRPEDMGKIYIGPKGQETYETFLKECVAGGVDGVSLVPDEEHLLWSASRSPKWGQFHERSKDKRKHFTPVEYKGWIVARNKMAAGIIKERKESIQKVRADCVSITDGARLLHRGDPYDVIGHIADVDYLGCHYQPHIVRRWAAAARNRRAYMSNYVHRTVRYAIEAMLQGARLIGSYRYNYIEEPARSADHRIRENVFIDQFVECGGTRRALSPIAFLVSRASEAWWPMDHGGSASFPAKRERAWAVSEIMYNFLMKNGYTFDVYYLDQAADLDVLSDYRLIVVPFAYSMPKAALEHLTKAYESGANFVICERKGEVDEVGRRCDRPLLEGLIEKGTRAGRVRFLDRDLLTFENKRSYLRELTSVVDSLLGKRKDLFLKRYDNRIEAMVAAVGPTEQYLSIINWENRKAGIEVGLNLPGGRYKILALSSDRPAGFREGLIEGKKTFSADELRNFAVKLNADEVVSLYVIPADRQWGQE